MKATIIVDTIPTMKCDWCKNDITDIKCLIITGQPIVCEKCYENLSANSGVSGRCVV